MTTAEFGTKADANGRFDQDPDGEFGLVERYKQDHPPTPAEVSATRAKSALAMRIRGASFEDIAEFLEYATPASARQTVERLLADVADADGPQAWQTQRQLHRLRLEGLLKVAYEKATTEPKPTIDADGVEHEGDDSRQESWFRRATEVLDRLGRLDGFDAPARAVIYTPEAAEFDSVIQSVLAASAAGRQVEGDIFELEALPVLDAEEIREEDFDDAEDEDEH